MPGDVQISARVPREHVKALEQRAAEADRTLSAELRRAIRIYLAAANTHREDRRLVYCAYCHKTHSVKPGEEQCAEGTWLDPEPLTHRKEPDA